MHKILPVIIIFVLIVILVILEESAEFFYKHTDSYKRRYLSGFAHLYSDIPDGLEIINLGSGPGLRGISYEYCRLKGYNFSTAPQNFENGFKLLKRFTNKIKSGAIIIILIMCPMSFGRNKDKYSPSYSDKFYGLLAPSEIEGYSLFRAFKLGHPLLMRLLAKIRRRSSRQEQVNHVKADKQEAKLPPVVSTWLREFELNNLTDPSQAKAHSLTFREKINVLEHEIEYCHVHNWKPVIVIPPIPETTRGYISSEFIKAFTLENIQALAKRFPDLRVLNYYDDTRITHDMFQDSIFLNAWGKEAFSKILFSDIDIEKGDSTI